MMKTLAGLAQPLITALVMIGLFFFTPLQNFISPLSVKAVAFSYAADYATFWGMTYLLSFHYRWYWWFVLNPVIFGLVLILPPAIIISNMSVLR